MAGLGRKVWSAGEVVTAANVQGYLQDQTTQVFASSAARSSALGTAVSEGMTSYLSDVNEVQVYDGSAWTLPGVPDVAGKNKIINGAFDFWQRGTSTSITTVSNTYAADRWVTTLNQRTSGTLVVKQNTADKQTTDNYALEIDATGLVTTSVLFHTQILETKDVVPLRGKTLTLSYWAKVASGSGTFLATVRDGTDTDSFPSTSSTQTEVSNTFTTTWQKFTVTHTVQAGANSICVRFTTPTAFAGKLFLSQVQLEAGSVATPFSRAAGTLQGELAACQRYYIRFSQSATFSMLGGLGNAISTTSAHIKFFFPVEMRTAPTSIESNYANIGIYDGVTLLGTTSVTLGGAKTTEAQAVHNVASGATQYRSYYSLSGAGAAYIGFNAEL